MTPVDDGDMALVRYRLRAEVASALAVEFAESIADRMIEDARGSPVDVARSMEILDQAFRVYRQEVLDAAREQDQVAPLGMDAMQAERALQFEAVAAQVLGALRCRLNADAAIRR